MSFQTYTEKRDLVQTYRRNMDWLINLCDCAGEQPVMDDTKAETHREDCPYRKRIETQTKETP